MTIENIEKVFDGIGLSEEVTDKIKTIFAAAVNESKSSIESILRASIMAEFETKSNEYKAYLDEEFKKKTDELQENYDTNAKKLVEQYHEKVSNLETQAEAYMTESVKQWIAEQQVPITNALKMEKMEKFVSSMRNLFEESAILMPEANFSLSEELQKEIESLKECNQVLTGRLQTINEEMFESKKSNAFLNISEGLTDLEIEKLKTLSESIDAKTIDDYTARLNTLKEAFISSSHSQNVNESAPASNTSEQTNRKLSLTEAISAARNKK